MRLSGVSGKSEEDGIAAVSSVVDAGIASGEILFLERIVDQAQWVAAEVVLLALISIFTRFTQSLKGLGVTDVQLHVAPMPNSVLISSLCS